MRLLGLMLILLIFTGCTNTPGETPRPTPIETFVAIDIFGMSSYCRSDEDRSRALGGDKNLQGAKLCYFDFTGADLRNVNFSGADLFVIYLKDADLTGSDLSGANLTGASFEGAILRDVNLKGANIAAAYFKNADLSGATWVDGSVCAEGSIGRYSCDKDY